MSNTVRRRLLIRVIPLSLLVVVITAVAGWLGVRTFWCGLARLDRVLTAPPTDERIAAHLRAHRELERPHGKRGDRFFEATYLIADERLNQMTGAEVVELLGPPGPDEGGRRWRQDVRLFLGRLRLERLGHPHGL